MVDDLVDPESVTRENVKLQVGYPPEAPFEQVRAQAFDLLAPEPRDVEVWEARPVARQKGVSVSVTGGAEREAATAIKAAIADLQSKQGG